MEHTTLKLARFCLIFMYNMIAFEHKWERYNKRGLIAKMPYSARLQAQLRK